MKTLRVLIVDDEPLIRAGIRLALDQAPDVEVAGECGSGADAVRYIQSRSPDIVLLDVRMPDATGLDVVREIGVARMPAVIFVTAYDEYAVEAFELNAVDYVLKPFNEDRLLRSIERARERLTARDGAGMARQLEALIASGGHKWPDRIVVKNNEAYEFVPVGTIDWVESADNYVQLHCGAKTHLVSETMTGLERRLDPSMFLRIHRGRLVNSARIVSITPVLNGAYEVELRGGIRLSSGRQYKSAIHSLIGRAVSQ